MTKLMILRMAYRTMCCLEQRDDVEILHTDKIYDTFVMSWQIGTKKLLVEPKRNKQGF